jgi:thioredoxin reductase
MPDATTPDAAQAPDVLVVGGGPAGLTAAARLREMGIVDVIVVEREREAGGIPRHSDHSGYGVRDLRRVMTGPQYARRLVDAASASGADIRVETMVTGWSADGAAEVTSPSGRIAMRPRAVLLATGARERPRSARMVPGDRPPGVLTTGQLQTLVHLRHRDVGSRAVIVGSELVSWSAVMTLREAGCSVAAMVTTSPRVEAPAGVGWAGRTALKVPMLRRARVVRIVGRDRVEHVEVENVDTGERTRISCDVVVFTGDWTPDSELARRRGLEIDDAHRGPLVDSALRTSINGVFAAGNVLHPVDTADVASLDGRHAAEQIARWLDGQTWRSPALRLVAGDAFAWVAPGLMRAGDPPPARGRLLLWPREHRVLPVVVAEQDGRIVGRVRLPWPAAPGRMFRVPWSLLAAADPAGGDVVIRLA